MHQISFHNIPQNYASMLNQIKNPEIQKIYQNFSFKYFQCFINMEVSTNGEKAPNKNKFEAFLFDYIKNFNFITYTLNNSVLYSSYFDTSIQKLNQIPNNQIIDVVFCVENECIIIDKVNISLINKIITNLQELNISIIDSSIGNSNIINPKEKEQIQGEIDNFCNFFQKKIKQNYFFERTIRPISCYLIRRHFYPTIYFNDQSFFDFDQENQISIRKIKSYLFDLLKFTNLRRDNMSLFLRKLNKCNNLFVQYGDQKYWNEKNMSENKYKEFKESDFIILRMLYSNIKACFYLVIHIKTLYIFTMKKLNKIDKITKETDHEIFFCKNYSHFCLTHFYGFLKDKNNEKIIGFIYEFMPNGTLKTSILSDPVKDDQNFPIIAIFQLYQGIEYLHLNKLIHRDLKPSNILFDNDFFAYISDYDNTLYLTQKENSNEPFTNDIGSILYTSPEQDNGENISYPTDIYSFGLLIYYLFEKKDMHIANETKGENKIQEKNLSIKDIR